MIGVLKFQLPPVPEDFRKMHERILTKNTELALVVENRLREIIEENPGWKPWCREERLSEDRRYRVETLVLRRGWWLWRKERRVFVSERDDQNMVVRTRSIALPQDFDPQVNALREGRPLV